MTQRCSKQAQRGYTLTEVLVALAVFTAIFLAALLVYDRANRVFKSSVDASDVQQTTRVAFERLVADLRMAGFDFDRDGFPMGARKYQQPDEQIEFMHERAITIRTNLNYETAAGNDNGRETDYEPGFATPADDTDDYFPVVTTANNEIVTYALKSDNGANNDTIRFFADIAKPRRTYPEPGGANETEVVIPGVNLCVGGCMNPPYTLYRITLKEDGTPDTPVPIANNIRSMSLAYFSDALTTAPLVPNGGTGRFIVTGGTTPAADITARELRGSTRSIRLNLVGMSPGADASYVEPIEAALPVAEQVATARRHRQYRLQSTIVPRNLGKRGVQEIDVRVPGAPNVRRVCSEGCGVPRIEWDAPAVGFVDAYVVVFDTSPTGAYNSPPTDAGRNLFAYVDKNLDPAVDYYFKVIAKNAFGSQISLNYGGPIKPINRTKPMPPTILSVTGNPAGPAAVENDIVVTWRAPNANVSPAPLNSCGIPSQPPTIKETRNYRVFRSTTPGFTPDDNPGGNMIWSGSITDTGIVLDENSGMVTFTDRTPKLACETYYYQVIGVERCNSAANLNMPNDIALAISDTSNEMEGEASAGGVPKAPENVHATIASTCSSDPCSITLEWNEVTQDVNDKPILVQNYNIRRQRYDLGFPVGSPVPMTHSDPILADGTVTFTDNTAPQPAAGTIYHYTVSAVHCDGTLASAFSSPDAKYPCAVLVAMPGTTPLDGDGSAGNPWLINNDTATIVVTSNTDLLTATAVVNTVPASGTPIVPPVNISGSNRIATVSFNMAGANGLFQVDIQLTDINGCGSTVTRYVQESPTSCCLLPYKLADNTIFDSTILSLATNTVTVTLKNQCDTPLTIDTLRLQWTFGASGNDLISVTYLDAPTPITDNFGGVPDVDGLAAVNPATVGAPNVIPGNGSYRVALRFQRNQTTLDTVTNFCARYSRDGLTLEDCRVAQTLGTVCP